MSPRFSPKRASKWLAGLALLGFAIVGCGGEDAATTESETEAGTPTEGGSVVWARYGDADSLDPQRNTTTLSWQVFDQLYDPLLAF